MRALLLVLAVIVIGGCAGSPSPHVAFAVSAPRTVTYLRYRVTSPAGEWTREFVVGRHELAERREVAGRSYVVGLEGDEAWLRVGSNAPVEIDGELAAEERREAAWIGMRFADPLPGAHTELESCHEGTCTYVHVPHDGHAVWVEIDRSTERPTSFSWVTPERSIELCDRIKWSLEDGALAVSSAACSAIVHEVGRVTTRWRLEERRSESVAPAWAVVDPEELEPLRPLDAVAVFPALDPSTRIYVPVDAGGSELPKVVVDTGSPWTILSRRALAGQGVVLSPDPPVHARQPYLPEGTYDAAIVDRLRIGDVEVHGARVLVTDDDGQFAGEEAGLLGIDLLSRFTVDVDGPGSALRLWPRHGFVADADFTDVPYAGASHGRVVVAGEVSGVGPLPVIVDTGAALNLVVGGPAMHAHYPHHRGDDVVRLEDGSAADYFTDIDGFSLGPFAFPRMPAMGHERRPELPFLDDDEALVGLGVLRHLRIVFSPGEGVLHVAPGPSYIVLGRYGVEVEERGGAPVIARVLGAAASWSKPVSEGDVLLAIDGRAVRTRDEALAALARAERGASLTIDRSGNRIVRHLPVRSPQ